LNIKFRDRYSFLFEKKTYVLLLAIGILLRLAFMPFTMMTDLSHQYYQFSYDRMNDRPYMHSVPIIPLAFPFHYLMMSAYSLVIPAESWYDATMLAKAGNITNPDEFMQRTYVIEESFLSAGPVFLKIFMMKFPYLIFDLLILFLLPLLFSRNEDKRLAFLFWLFNPISFMASFIFGTYDVAVLFFVVLGLLCLSRNRIYLGASAIVFASLLKPYFAMLLPFVLLHIIKKAGRLRWKQSVLFCVASLTVFFAFMSRMLSNILTLIDEVWPSNYILNLRTQPFPVIYIFIVAYTITLLSYWYFSGDSFNAFCKYTLLALLSFFGLCLFHPQWFVIVLPFMIFMMVEDRSTIRVFVIQMLSVISLLLYWENHLTINLFAPISSGVLNFPSIQETISSFMKFDVLMGLLWSFFVALTVLLIMLIIRSIVRDAKKGHDSHE